MIKNIIRRYESLCILLKYRIGSLVTMYSMGKDLECLKTDYLQAVRAMQEYWTPYGYYQQMLWLLSIGIMLDYEDDILHVMLTLIEQEEVKDHVYDVLLNYRFTERKKLADSDFLLYSLSGNLGSVGFS